MSNSVIGSALFEIQHGGVHAIAQASWFGAVFENVAQVRAALAADHFDATHSVARVGLGGDAVRSDGFRKAGPSGAGFELGVRLKQRIPAAHALVGCMFVIVPILSCEGRLGAFAARDRVLLGRQLFAPVFIGFLYLWRHRVHYCFNSLHSLSQSMCTILSGSPR